MKRIFTIIALFSSVNVYSQILSEFETGYLKYDNRILTPKESNRYHQKSMFSTFYIGYKYKKFTINTETSIFFYQKRFDKLSFSPIQSEFIFSLSYQFKNITFSYSHLCAHPISSNDHDYQNNRLFFESHDKISIRVKIN